MEIRRVRVRNIRSFDAATLDLEGGTTLLWGDVGSGKTSLLYAIEMALFGFAEVDATYLIRHRAPSAEVSLTLADDGHEYVFSRRFHRKTRRGRDTYEPDEKGTGLARDGSTTRYPPTELRRQAIELLGFPDNPNPRAHSDLWRWAVYVPQERMRQILESGDADARLETVRKALGLERYRNAADNAQLLARELRGDAVARDREADLLRHWEEDLDRQRTAVVRAEEGRSAAIQEEASERGRLAGIATAIEAVEARRRKLAADRRELESVEGRRRDALESQRTREEALESAASSIRALEAEVEEMDRRSAQLPEVRRHREAAGRERDRLLQEVDRLEEIRRQFEVAEADLRAATELRSASEATLRRASGELSESLRRLQAARGEGPPRAPTAPTPRSLSEIDIDIRETDGEAEKLAGEVRHRREALEELERLIAGGVCPRCGQRVDGDSFGRHRSEASGAFEDATGRYRTVAEHRDRIKSERGARDRYERAFLSWEAAEKRRQAATAESERVGIEVERLRAEHAGRAARVDEATRRVASLAPQVEALRTTRESLRSTEAILADLEERLAALTGLEAVARGKKEAIAATRRQLESLRAAAREEDRQSSELRERSEALAAAVRGASSVEPEAEALGRQRLESERALETTVGRRHRSEGDLAAATEGVRAAERHVAVRRELMKEGVRLREIAEFLHTRFRERLLELEHRLLGHAKVEFDRSLARFFGALIEDPSLVARSDPRFSPLVEVDGEPTPPEALSGGERTALALAFRLALAEVVRRAGRLRLSTLILDEPTDGFSPEQVQRMGELLGELGVPQVLLVSHEAVLGSAADRVVRIRKVDGRSEIEPERGPMAGRR
ncbi:MAG TPA: SMC family ATPase [Thermoplasmata archaeon]|nr:SMC family ATPase [Thermoplasmata archaeon]